MTVGVLSREGGHSARRPGLRLAMAASLLAAGASLAGCGPHGPRLQVRALADLPRPLPYPYDAAADPAAVNAVVDAAFARARGTNKRVIVDFGGNWCKWCRMLAGVMALPEARPFIARNFEVVSVNVSSTEGQFDQNTQVLRRLNVGKIDGVPWLVVAEPDGKVLSSSYEITDDHHHTPQSMIDWLAKWAKAGGQ
jgi:thiol:disulfide interchange protein